MTGPGGTIYTIGHSNHPLGYFMALLAQHRITTICDVRSVPYSRMNPQFNRETLSAALLKEDVAYLFLGRELGARSEDPSCYSRGKVQFDRVTQTALFQGGIDVVIETMGKGRTALMCAERDPLNCHRTILVSRRLVARGVAVEHILWDSTTETHEHAVARLLRQLHMPEVDELFRTREDMINDAYKVQGERIAYVTKTPPDTEAGKAGEGLTMKIFTIGFTKKSAEVFFTKLQRAGVTRLVDIRLNNVSQLAGFAKRDDLRYFLRAICDIDYTRLPELAPTQEIMDEYKSGKADWDRFRRQFMDLMASRKVETKVPRELLDGAGLLCSEDKPLRCHRSLVAEYFKTEWGDVEIEHIT